MKKYITTTLPYINSIPHIGHCFEFVLADVLAEHYRYKYGKDNVIFNVGTDEHGQKIYQKAQEEGFSSTQEYCDILSEKWKEFCKILHIDYDVFYRTTSDTHKENVIKFFNEIKHHTYQKNYKGKYCIGCESFKTEKEIIDNKCQTHNIELTDIEEDNIFFDLNKFSDNIKDILIDKSLSNELENILKEKFELSITRRNVKWGINIDNDTVFYVWFDALLNYIFSIKYYEDNEYFNEFWANSFQICGKDNLKFQAFIFQSLLLANNIPQTKELLVHGTILDECGVKMSKSLGNVIDPIEQSEKFGIDPLRYYLCFGLNTFVDSCYSEKELIHLWNIDLVNGLGNLISRLLHLIDTRNVKLNRNILSANFDEKLKCIRIAIDTEFEKCNFREARNLLNNVIYSLNKKINDDKPYSKECTDYSIILNKIYFELKKYTSLLLYNIKITSIFFN
jgi:methionyl-tRNA synthetase